MNATEIKEVLIKLFQKMDDNLVKDSTVTNGNFSFQHYSDNNILYIDGEVVINMVNNNNTINVWIDLFQNSRMPNPCTLVYNNILYLNMHSELNVNHSFLEINLKNQDDDEKFNQNLIYSDTVLSYIDIWTSIHNNYLNEYAVYVNFRNLNYIISTNQI